MGLLPHTLIVAMEDRHHSIRSLVEIGTIGGGSKLGHRNIALLLAGVGTSYDGSQNSKSSSKRNTPRFHTINLMVLLGPCCIFLYFYTK